MRRGQFEIMGLAVLIVIIIIGAAFFMTRPSKDTGTAAADYEYDQLAQSTVNAFLIVDVGAECPGYRMYDLVRDAAINKENPCGSDSASILKERAQTMLGNITNTKYDFSIVTEDNPDTPIVTIQQCIRTRGTSLSRTGLRRVALISVSQNAVVSLQFCPEAQ